VPVTSQLTAHRAERSELPGRHGPIAALRGTPRGTTRATALLVPGYTGSKEDFAPLLDACTEAGFRPIAIDLPGQYESPGPEDRNAYLPAALGEVVAELAGKLAGEGPPVLLLGHSYGGLVARAAVLSGAPVAGLTLMDTGPGMLPDGFRRSALDVGEPLLRGRGIEAAYALREEVSARFPAWTALAAELKDFLRARFVASTPAGLLGMADGLRTEPDRVDELAGVLRSAHVPALVVAGAGDDAWSVPVQRDMARRLGATFALVPGAAHSPNTENPAGLLDVLLPAWSDWVA
jgi:pimeloyl-ACP methyl ester carboxylesterase